MDDLIFKPFLSLEGIIWTLLTSMGEKHAQQTFYNNFFTSYPRLHLENGTSAEKLFVTSKF